MKAEDGLTKVNIRQQKPLTDYRRVGEGLKWEKIHIKAFLVSFDVETCLVSHIKNPHQSPLGKIFGGALKLHSFL